MKNRHDPTARHMLERPMTNAMAPGVVGETQRRAMWAKRKNPTSMGGQNAPPPSRPWGESRPGEMYPQVEGPGNPSWEKRHPEYSPKSGGASETPPARTWLPVPPVTKTPRASPDIPYGGDARVAPSPDPSRPYIPVPRVPIPGYPKNPPQNGSGSASMEAIRAPDKTPPESAYDKIMRQIAEIRARPGDGSNIQTATKGDPRFMPTNSGYPSRAALPPGHSIWSGMQPTSPPGGKVMPKPGSKNGIWSGGSNPDPALKKKLPRGGRINNRARAAIHFLEQHATR